MTTETIAIKDRRIPFGAQKAIAAKVGVSESYVSNVANGLAQPRTERGWRTYRRVQREIRRVMARSAKAELAKAELAQAS